MINIYALIDPTTDQIRYVGQTKKKLQARLRGHINYAERCGDTYLLRWIRVLLRNGNEPSIELLEEVEDTDWAAAERSWIKRLKAVGCRLTNATAGGDGVFGLKHRPESKEKMRKAHLGKKLTEEHKRKVGEAGRGRKRSATSVAKMVAKLKGRSVPLERRKKISETLTGRIPPDEQRQKMLDAWAERKAAVPHGHVLLEEAAKFLGVTKGVVANQIHKGRMAGVKLKNCWFVNEQTLIDFDKAKYLKFQKLTITCRHCGTIFQSTKRGAKRFCSDTCRKLCPKIFSAEHRAAISRAGKETYKKGRELTGRAKTQVELSQRMRGEK